MAYLVPPNESVESTLYVNVPGAVTDVVVNAGFGTRVTIVRPPAEDTFADAESETTEVRDVEGTETESEAAVAVAPPPVAALQVPAGLSLCDLKDEFPIYVIWSVPAAVQGGIPLGFWNCKWDKLVRYFPNGRFAGSGVCLKKFCDGLEACNYWKEKRGAGAPWPQVFQPA